MLLLGSSLTSCKGYRVVKGEVVIDDEQLTQTTLVDDNNGVFYEIMTGSFSDSNGDGIGDLRGIIERLDYLNDGDPNSGRSLGIQGIWLTPIFKSPTYHKYDVTDYYTIDPNFGTMDDLKDLIEECHKRGIKLIIDLVLNHTGDQNQWFKSFIKAHNTNDETNPYYDFYSYYNIGSTPPNGNKYSTYGNSKIYYECNFSGNMPELNYDNEVVRETVLEVAKYYIDLGIDGFRFDAAKYIYYGDNIKSSEFWNWYIGELKSYKPDIYTVGEVWDADGIVSTYQKEGLDCFNFSVSAAEGKIFQAAKGGNVTTYTRYVESYLNKLNTYGYNGIMHQFLTNHDMDRAAGFATLNNGYAKMAANLYILSSGSPFIYYGEEIGIKGSRGSANSDANRRVAMLWGDDDTIKDPSETTYDPAKQVNGTVKEQLKDQTSLYNHYKKLIMIRNAYPQIARGAYKAIPAGDKTVGGFTATYNDSTVCVIHNTSINQPLQYDLSKITTHEFTSIAIYIGNEGVTLENGILTISPQTTVILK